MTATSTATRLIQICEARLARMVDGFGQKYANAPMLELLIAESPDARWQFEQIGRCFVAECDGFVQVYWHDGSEHNEGGFAGREISIEMKDGSKRMLRGPWAGAPSTFYSEITTRFGHLADVHFTRERERWTGNKGLTFGYWITMERALEACATCPQMLPELPMIQPVPVVCPDGGVNFALIKRADCPSEWRFDRAEGFPSLSVDDTRPDSAVRAASVTLLQMIERWREDQRERAREPEAEIAVIDPHEITIDDIDQATTLWEAHRILEQKLRTVEIIP